MAGPIKHTYKINAMVKFGKMKKRTLFSLAEMRHYMNNYVGVSGRVSQHAGTTAIQLTSLIRIHPDFVFYPNAGRKSAVGLWQYIGEIDGKTYEEEE